MESTFYVLKKITAILLVVTGTVALFLGILFIFGDTLKPILLAFGVGSISLWGGLKLSQNAEDALPVDDSLINDDNIYLNNFPKHWAEVFTLIDRAGGVKMPRIKELSPRARMKARMNWFAFVFGPLYYLIKGMWRPMLSYLLIMILFIIAFDYLALTYFGKKEFNVSGTVFGVVWGMLANTNYYKMRVLGKKNWL